jgi:hypothetical protein
VWSEVLRNPDLAERFGRSLRPMQAELARVVREHQAASAPGSPTPEALAALVLSIIQGYIVQLSLFGPRSAAGVKTAVRALWPA